MTLVRWTPMTDLLDEMNWFLGDVCLPTRKGRDVAMMQWAPRVDIVEGKDAYEITADLPGIEKENMKIEVKDHVLTLRGEKKLEEEKKEKNYRLAERYYGEFTRTFTLPEDVNTDGIQAAFKDGVLKVAIPKVEKAEPKQIEVKVN